LAALLVLNQISLPLFAYRGEVENIPPRAYFETAQREMARAKKSISLYMYLLSFRPNDSQSHVFQLLKTLKEAHDRGVTVEVVLDKNYNFAGEEGAAGEGKNLAAYAFLKASGISVYFDEAGTYTHAKALIIDGETVVTGSSNWTRAALELNEEANVLIRSKEVARDMLKTLESIKRESPAAVGPAAKVPAAFLLDPNLLGRMASQPDERAFDVYLYLVWRAGPRIVLDYQQLAEHLGIASMGKHGYGRQINKTLGKLEERYGLIRATTTYGKDAEVTLLAPWENHPPPESSPARGEEERGRNLGSDGAKGEEEENLQVPVGYWEWGWNRRLGFAGKVFYLINLREGAVSPIQPRWSQHIQTLAKRYGVSPWFITRGVTELRRANLLEVEYDAVGPTGPSGRAPNVYSLNPLYDPGAFDRALEELKKRVGADKVERARRAAALVYEDSYLRGIEQLIELEDQYGRARIQEAERILGAKSPDNPKRKIGYLIETIRGLK
jgi:HKD family nuclease